jgi:hypothetical protein
MRRLRRTAQPCPMGLRLPLRSVLRWACLTGCPLDLRPHLPRMIRLAYRPAFRQGKTVASAENNPFGVPSGVPSGVTAASAENNPFGVPSGVPAGQTAASAESDPIGVPAGVPSGQTAASAENNATATGDGNASLSGQTAASTEHNPSGIGIGVASGDRQAQDRTMEREILRAFLRESRRHRQKIIPSALSLLCLQAKTLRQQRTIQPTQKQRSPRAFPWSLHRIRLSVHLPASRLVKRQHPARTRLLVQWLASFLVKVRRLHRMTAPARQLVFLRACPWLPLSTIRPQITGPA